MADSDKNIVITPNISSSSDNPKIVFSGADASTAAQDITLYTYPTSSGTLSFEGSAGQLFSITNDLTGTIFSVNDVSGIPSIEVDADGTIRLAEFGGNVLIGTATDDGTNLLQVDGSVLATTFSGALSGNATTATTLQTSRTIALGGVLSGSASFDGSSNITITAAHTSDPVITLTGAVTGSGTMTNLGNVSISTTATADPTLTLAGDATGSATFTNLGNATLTVTVADDSHNHIISNVDGLQTALDAKLNLSGGTLTGNLSVSGDTFFGYGTLTADSQNDVVFFSANGTAAQSGAFHNKLKILGGASQSRDLQLYQQDSGYAWLDTSWTGNSLNISSNFTALNVNTPLNVTEAGAFGKYSTFSYGISANSLTIGGDGANTSSLGQTIQTTNNGVLYLNYSSTGNVVVNNGGTGYLLGATSVRSPIFYDSDNTAYYVNPASRSFLNGVSSVGLQTSWGTTSGSNTGALNSIMGTGANATWLLSGTSGGTFRYGIQALDAGGSLRLYVGSNYLAFDGSTLFGTNLSGNATTATTLQTARTINGVSFNGSANITVADATKLPLAGGTLTGDLTVNGDITNQNDAITKARMMGWVPAYSNSNETTVKWDTDEAAIALGPVSQGGMAFKAIRMKSGDTVRLQVQIKGSTADTDGVYVRIYYYNGDLPDGKTHVSNSATYSLVQEETSGDNGWYENSAITTSWVGFERTYTAPADGYMSLVILNWAGYAGTLYVKQPDIQFQNVYNATTLQTARTINGVSFDGSANITVTANTPNTLTRGTYLTGSNFNGSAATTWAVDATTAATASKVVARDGNGYVFASYYNSAGTFSTTGVTSGMARFTGTNGTDTYGRSYTAAAAATLLSGSTMDIAGNATTATTLATARTINGVSFNGSANITVADATKLPLTGGTLTGDLSVSTDITAGSTSKTSDTEIRVQAGDLHKAGFIANGSAQGTAYFEWSQNSTGTIGGGVVYNGDGSPAFGASEVTDRTTFYRISSIKYKVFDYPYNSNTVTFYGDTTAAGTVTSSTSSRAPIFYDTNNTGYYIDPASTGTAGKFNGTVICKNVAETVVGISTTLDPGSGGIQYRTLTANTTFTAAFATGESLTLRLNGGDIYTVTWPTMTWITSAGNVAPTLNGTNDVLVFWQYSGSLYGAYAGHGA